MCNTLMCNTLFRTFRRYGLSAVVLGTCLALGLAGQTTPHADSVVVASTTSSQSFIPQANFKEAGLILREGRKLSDARKSMERAAEKGDVAAQINLAVFYMNGWGTRQNYAAALYWFQSAAKSGNALAHTNLGILYLNGWGVTRDYDEAARNFRFAAEHGETGAMVNLGYLSDTGLGTTKDQTAAAEWYRRAAERGDPLGQNNLADLYLRGEGVQQSDSLAFDGFQKAATQRQTAAMIKLGFLYMTGRAVRRNPETAYAWIMAASLAGDHRGDSYISALQSQLGAQQISRANERAHALLTRPVPTTTIAQFH